MRLDRHHRLRMLTAGIGGALVVALLGVPSAVLAGPAASRPSGIEVEHDETHWVGHDKAGSTKGIIAVRSLGGDRAAVAVAFQGLPRTGAIALIASKKPCEAAPGRSLALGTIRGAGSAATKVNVRRKVTVAGLLPFMEQSSSFRVVRTSAPKRQLVCVPVVAYGSPPAAASSARSVPAASQYELKNVLVSSFVAPGDVAGMKVAGLVLVTPNAESFSLNFEEIKQTVGTHRIVGSTVACGTRTTPDGVVFSHSFVALPAGNAGADVTVPVQGDPLSVASIRFFRGASGFGQQEGCSNIIAVLIGL